LCISVDAAELEEAAAGVAHIDPLIYASAVPAGLSRVYPVLAGVVAGARVAGAAKVAVSNTGVFVYILLLAYQLSNLR
jgi:hypothetical protein